MSAKGQAQTQTLPPQPAACPAPRTAGAALGRQCAQGCGAHTLAGGVCKDCRREGGASAAPNSESRRAAVSKDAADVRAHANGPRQTAAPAGDERTPAPQPRPGRTFAGVRASVRIDDADASRAEATRELLTRLVTQLGLDAERVEIRVDAEAERRTESRGASGLMSGGIVYLHPRRFDPRTRAGASLIGHELVHAAQRANAPRRPALAPAHDPEAEARRLGDDFADGRLIERPRAALPARLVAADVGLAAFDALATQTYRAEIARIHQLLATGFTDWYISDEEVRQILTILSVLPFVTARSVIAALPEGDQKDLINNLDTPHYKPFRMQILAVYWGTRKEVLQKFGVELFTPLDLREMNELEIYAVNDVFDRLDPATRKSLLAHEKLGPVFAEIKEYMSATSPESVVGAINRAFDKALTEATDEEKKRREEAASAKQSFAANAGQLKVMGDWIRAKMSEVWVSDADAIEVLGKLAVRYLDQPEMLRALADYLIEPEAPKEGESRTAYEYKETDHLDKLLRETPINKLYTEPNLRQVFMRLLSFRPATKNEALAEKLMDPRWWVPVSTDEAYLAFMLVRALPQRARETFFKSEGGARWALIFKKLSLQMRESEELNLYTGGKEDKDRQSILIQLLSDDLWAAKDTTRLEGLIRMAIAAGERQFVFEQSRQREAYKTGAPELKSLVEKFKLYNPGANPARLRPPAAETLDPDASPSKLWAALRILFGSDFYVNFKDIFFNVESAGGARLNLAAAQDAMGGSLSGIRLSTEEERKQRGGKAEADDKEVNFASANYLANEKFAEVHAAKLDLSAISLPIGEVRFQTGTGSVTDITLRIRASEAGWALPSLIDLHAKELVLNDVLIVQRESMKGIKTFLLQNVNVTSAQAGEQFAQAKGMRDTHGAPPPVFAELINTVWLAPGVQTEENALVPRELPQVPQLPLEFDLSFEIIKLVGLTTSGGQFVEEIEIKNLRLRGGGDVGSYRRALNSSAERLAARLKAENAAFEKAAASQNALAMSRHADSAKQLRDQLEHTQEELKRLDQDEAEVKRLEEQQRTNPESFTAADRIKLRRLKAALSGATLDADSVVMRGVAGYTNAGAAADSADAHTIRLADVHGQGQAVTSALGLLGDPGQLRELLGGTAARATYSGEGKSRARFALDLGHVEIPNLLLKGDIPSAKDAQHDLERFEEKHQPWRPSHKAELARLKERADLAAKRDALIAKPGLAQLNEQQRKDFGTWSKRLDELEQQAAVTVGRVIMEGTTLGFGADNAIDVGADKFTALDVRKGANRIASVTGEDVHIGVELTDGIGGLDKWRENLIGLKVSGTSLTATGITNEEAGLSIDSASLLGIEEASLDIAGAGRSATAHLSTKMVIVSGVRLKNVEEAIEAEYAHLAEKLKNTPPAARTARDQRRLLALEGKRAELAGLRKAVADAKLAREKAKGKQRIAAADQTLARAEADLARWTQGLIAEQLAFTDVNVGVLGLGDVLGKDYDFDEALRGEGIRIKGRGPGDRLFSKAEAIESSVPGLSGKKVTTGALTGEIIYNEEGTTLRNINLASLAVEGLEWHGGKKSISSKGTCSLLGINVDAFFGDTKIDIKKLDIATIIGEQLVYKDDETGLEAVVQSGGLGGVHVTDLLVELPLEKGQDTKISKGRVVADKVNNLAVNVKLLHEGLKGKGVLTGSNISVDFLTDKKRIFKVGDLSLASGEAKKLGAEHGISLSFKHLRGEVEEEKFDNGDTKYTFRGIGLSDFTLGPGKFADGGKTLEITGSAALKGAALEAVAILDKKGKPKQLLIDRLYVREINATGIHAIAEPPKTTKPGEKVPSRKEFWLQSGTILGLDITGLDLAKKVDQMKGKIAIQDSVDIQKLRVLIGDVGKDALDLTVSTKIGGEKATDAALRGRELSATLLGPDGFRFSLGTIGGVSGDLEGFGAKTGFSSGKITTNPIEMAADGSSIKVTAVEVNTLKLTKPVFKDGKGTTIQLTEGADVASVKIESIVAKFGDVVGPTGKTEPGMTSLDIGGMVFGQIDAKGFVYNGPATLETKEGAPPETKQTRLEAKSATITGLTLTKLSQDFVKKITKLNAKLDKVKVTEFAAIFTSTVLGQETKNRIFTDIETGGMKADLTLTGTKAEGHDWTSIEGGFELTDEFGIKLRNFGATKTVKGPQGEKVEDLVRKLGDDYGIDLTGLKVKFLPNGTMLVNFDELAARSLSIKIGSKQIVLKLAKLQKGELALGGLGLDKGIEVLAAKLNQVVLEGAQFTMTVERKASTGQEKVESWVLTPLRSMEGELHLHVTNIPKVGSVDVTFPVHAGVINFDDVDRPSHGVPLPAPLGVDERGIYADLPNIAGGRRYLYPSTAHTLSGVTPEDVSAEGRVLSRGRINLPDFIKGEMEQPAEAKAAADLSGLNDLQLRSEGAVQLGTGVMGSDTSRVTLKSTKQGDNAFVISGASIGRDMHIDFPAFRASKAEFEAGGKKGETGNIEADIHIAINGLGNTPDAATGIASFTITLSTVKGNISDIKYGDVKLLLLDELRKRPAPSPEKK